MALKQSSKSSFQEDVKTLRHHYETLRNKSNLCPPTGKLATDVQSERLNGCDVETFWFEDGQCVRLAYIPGTLSGNILSLVQNLPAMEGHFEIWGNRTRKIETPPAPPYFDDDTEDISTELSLLPVIQVDRSKHFVKKGKYRSEIHNLLECQGGTCPGKPLSPHIVQLLGRSSANELVFDKLFPRYFILPHFCSIAIYKRWILDIIAAFRCLHGLGIVYRDLHIENLLFTKSGDRLVLGDLEGRWGQRSAPEIAREDRLDSGWTEKSDIFDLGTCIKCIIYANIPISPYVEWPVPQPFQAIVEACRRPSPASRPDLNTLQAMVEAIRT